MSADRSTSTRRWCGLLRHAASVAAVLSFVLCVAIWTGPLQAVADAGALTPAPSTPTRCAAAGNVVGMGRCPSADPDPTEPTGQAGGGPGQAVSPGASAGTYNPDGRTPVDGSAEVGAGAARASSAVEQRIEVEVPVHDGPTASSTPTPTTGRSPGTITPSTAPTTLPPTGVTSLTLRLAVLGVALVSGGWLLVVSAPEPAPNRRRQLNVPSGQRVAGGR